MTARGSCYETVNKRHNAASVLRSSSQFGPDVCCFEVNADHALSVVTFQSTKPTLQIPLPLSVPQAGYTFSDFRHYKHANEKIFGREFLNGLANLGIGLRAA